MRHRHVLITVAAALALVSVQSAAAQATYLQASPASKDFGSVAVGGSSSQSFTITNTDPSNSYTISSVTDATSPVFQIGSNNCSGTTLGPSGSGTESCTFSVTFNPASTGSASDTVIVASDDPGGNLTIPVSGTGTGSAGVQFSGTTGYSTAPATTTSGAVLITNTGNVNLSIGTITLSGSGAGSFSLAAQGANNTCSNQAVGPNSSCSIQVTYAPSGPEQVSATLNVPSNAGTSPDHQAITGTADASVAQISPGSVSFANVPIGQTSSPQTVTISNTGVGTALGITSVAVVGDSSFTLSNNSCNGQSVSAGSSCTVDVTFSSTAAGSHTATLQAVDNASFGTASPQQITLSANATVPGIQTQPSTVPAFASTVAGKTSASQTVTITNSGQAPLSITSVTIGGVNFKNFAITAQSCTASSPIQPGGTCTVSAHFRPTTTGVRNGAIVLSGNLPTPSRSYVIGLTGHGLPPANVTGVRLASGCRSATVRWTPPRAGTPGYVRAWIVRNHARVPLSPRDGGIYFDTSRGLLVNTGMAAFTRYYYRVYAEYSFVSGVAAYSTGVVHSIHTGWVCGPLNGGLARSSTPTVSYLAYPRALGYAVVVYHGASKVFTGFSKSTSILVRHRLTPHAVYSLRLYGYTSARPRGFLMGTSTFTVE